MNKETEIITDAYKLINKLYTHILQLHERSFSKVQLTLLKETELFELKHGRQIESILQESKETVISRGSDRFEIGGIDFEP